MHYGAVVVVREVESVFLYEIRPSFVVIDNVNPVNPDIIISVASHLLVPHSQTVSDLVNWNSELHNEQSNQPQLYNHGQNATKIKRNTHVCPIHVHGVGQTKFSVDVHLYVCTCVHALDRIEVSAPGAPRNTGRLTSSQSVNNITDVPCGRVVLGF